jgi:hypothetical protein
MVVVPIATPVITPVPDPAVATLVLPLLHMPPGDASVNVIVLPAHILLLVPAMAPGCGFTVTICVT